MPSRTKKKKSATPIRGERIRFIRGAYAGELGWINAAKPATDLTIYVILDDGQPAKDDADYATHVRKGSCAPKGMPKNAEEYVIQEDPKVAYHLSKFCEAIAEAGFADAGATNELLTLVGNYVDLACAVQKTKGRKAKYSDIAWQVKELLKSKKKRNANDEDAMRA